MSLRLVALSALVALTVPTRGDGQARETPKRFVIVHGAWGGGWDWRGIDSILTRHGHTVDRVTLTGLGDRVHLASPNIGMASQVLAVVQANALGDDNMTVH